MRRTFAQELAGFILAFQMVGIDEAIRGDIAEMEVAAALSGALIEHALESDGNAESAERGGENCLGSGSPGFHWDR